MLWVQKVISTVIVDLQIGNMGGVDGSRTLKVLVYIFNNDTSTTRK